MKLRYLFPLLMGLLLSACSTMGQADTYTGVAVGGVNYSDLPITYALSDPTNPASVAGEPIDPFGAGGAMCCFRLPNSWQPGIKVRVQIYDTKLNLVKDELVDLPPYAEGKPGRLWLVHYQDGSVDVFTSENGPPHTAWPGRIKGWPVPSIEYRRTLWERDLELKKGDVRAAQKLLKQLKENPEKRLKESWAFKREHGDLNLQRFSSPEDPSYKEYLLKNYLQYLETSKQDVDNWMQRKP